MKYKMNYTNPFQGKKISPMTTVAIVSGIAIGAAIGALFATKKGRALKSKMIDYTENLFHQLTGNTSVKAKAKLGNLIGDVRGHIKQNAEGLLGHEQVVQENVLMN